MFDDIIKQAEAIPIHEHDEAQARQRIESMSPREKMLEASLPKPGSDGSDGGPFV